VVDEARPGASGESAASAASDVTRPLRSAVRGLTSVVAPASLVTSLLFYFGWVRTSVQADDLGLHDSLFGFSTRDYLLRSIDPMFWPLVVGLVAALAGLAFHVWLVSWATEASARDRRRALNRFAVIVGWGGVAAIVAGAVGSRLHNPSRLVFVAVPLVVTAGVVLAGYALHVRRRFVLRRRPVALSTTELTQLRLAASTLMVILLFVSLFWSVQRYAYVKGGDLARQLVRDLAFRPDVTIYSAKRLQLAAPVTETDLGGDNAEYRFRYTGLKLLFKSDGRYFLRPTDETSPLNIVVADANDLRFEFTGGYG
jgi:hypothetical protein